MTVLGLMVLQNLWNRSLEVREAVSLVGVSAQSAHAQILNQLELRESARVALRSLERCPSFTRALCVFATLTKGGAPAEWSGQPLSESDRATHILSLARLIVQVNHIASTLEEPDPASEAMSERTLRLTTSAVQLPLALNAFSDRCYPSSKIAEGC